MICGPVGSACECPPGCGQAKNETAAVMSHTHLLSGRAHMDQLLAAVQKVNGGLAEVKKHFDSQ